MAAIAVALSLAVPDAASAREIVGRTGWLLAVGLARAGRCAWSRARRRGRAPRIGYRLLHLAGFALLYACLAAGEHLANGSPGPWLGSLLAGWLGYSPREPWVAVGLAGFGMGVGVPLWLGRSWPVLLEALGGWMESVYLPALRRLLGSGAQREPAAAATRAARAQGSAPAVTVVVAADAAGGRRREKNLDTAHAGPARGRGPRSASMAPVMMDGEEIMRRVAAIHGGRLPGSNRRGQSAAEGVMVPARSQALIHPARPVPAGRRLRPGDVRGLTTGVRGVALIGTVSSDEWDVVDVEIDDVDTGDVGAGEMDIDEVDIDELDIDEGRVVVAERSMPVARRRPPAVEPVGVLLPFFRAPATVETPNRPSAHEAPHLPPELTAPRLFLRSTLAFAVPEERPAPRVQVERQTEPRIEPEPAPEIELEKEEDIEPEIEHQPKPKPLQPRFADAVCLPPLELLHAADSQLAPICQDDLIDRGILIEEKLAEFRVKVSVQDAYAGPVITRYEVQPAVGVRGGQVVNLVKDLARVLGVASIRVVETIPGKTCMGLELPNPRRQMIRLSEVLSSDAFRSHASKLAMVLGKDIAGEPVVADLAKAPHLLVAGTTGSGKSVGVNAMILSLLYRATPDEVRFVMIDPKMLELSVYDDIPHLLAPVVTDMKLAANALNWCVGEMERRYRLMSALGVRNLAGFNQKVRDAAEAGELLADPFSINPDNPPPLVPLPFVVVVVDEFADLMMVAGKKIEELIARLAQKARAAGIHLVLATQRPSVDVITGLIKANIPTRIAFQVSSKVDSRTILDQMGAESLLGQGDMLYLPPGTGYPQRVHGAFVADDEVHAVAEHLKQLGEPDYVDCVLGGAVDGDDEGTEADRVADETDPLYDAAVAFVIASRRASISAVQRQLRIGYNRAARLVEQMEAAGLVSPMESNGNRTVLVPATQS